MRDAVAICAACVMMVAVVSMLTCSYFVICASFNRRRPSQRWFVHANPLNAVFFVDELTPKGLEYRVKAFRVGVVGCIAIAVQAIASTFLAPFN